MNRESDLPLTKPRGQTGFALTEVIVAAAVFAMLALAVLAGIDAASSSTGREKARSVASALAEQEQERMHSIPALSLPGYYSKVDKTVGGIVYTVESQASWVTDATGGTISCTSEEGKADYLRLRTSVSSSTVGTSTAPVHIDSLLAPPAGSAGGNNGTLAVQVNDRDGIGVKGIRVDIDGPGGYSDVENTNDLGCAIFAYIPADTYDVGFSQLNWVDPEGTLNPHYSAIVTAGATTLKSILYDAKGKITAGFDTRYWDIPQGKFVPGNSRAWSLAASNSGVTSGVRVFEAAGSVPQHTFAADNLFPFKDGYGLYAGRCTEENPSAFDPAYGDANAFQLVDPNSTYDRTVTGRLRMPALPVRVANGKVGGSGTYKNRPKWISTTSVQAKLKVVTSSTCTNEFIPSVTANANTGLQTYPTNRTLSGTNGSGNNYENGMTGFVTKKPGNGTPPVEFDPGLPWGDWIVCADDGSRRNFVLVKNDKPDGVNLSASTVTPTAYKVLDIATGATGHFAAGSESKTCSQTWPTS